MKTLADLWLSRWGAAALGLACIAAFALPATAGAEFGIARWEAGTCSTDLPQPCSYASDESQFFTQVSGRANLGITDFAFNEKSILAVDGTVKDIRVDLPPGLSINPQAVPQCTEAELVAPGGDLHCRDAGTQVGTVSLVAFSEKSRAELTTPVFNIVPKPGVPAEFGFFLGFVHVPIFVDGTADWASDYHEGFTIHVPAIPTVELAAARLTFDGSRGDKSLITVGSDCHGSTTSTITVDSVEDPGVFSSVATTPISPDHVIEPTGCELVPFEPSFEAAADAGTIDSPTSLSTSIEVPFDPSDLIAQAHLKRVVVTLPRGMGLNPSAAGRLQACSDQQFGKGIAIGDPIADPAGVHPPPLGCPPGSAIGTVAIDTPALPVGSLQGTVYLGQQLSRDPASGKEYRVFLDAESPRFGVYLRLVGSIAADPVTGQLTATFDDPAEGGLPQVPFRSLDLNLDGAGGLLTNAATCGSHRLESRLVPWTGLAAVTPAASLQLSTAPQGGSCPRTLAERPFSPTFEAGLDDPRAARFSPLRIRIAREDGQQELKGADFTLPAGLTAKLAGVPYCPEAALAAAAQAAGATERDHPNCPAASRVGSVALRAGSGPSPIQIDGSAYLTGPYKGAPISLAVVTPALAGPFDLGTSLVRVALFVDPESASIRAVSDPIPDVFGGTKLDVRSIALNLDRREFALAGTNCQSGLSTAGALRGGGADPSDPASFSSLPVSAPLQVKECPSLRFGPKLGLRLSGATKRGKHPKLRVSLRARGGDANLRGASVALPHALFLNQASLAGVCTRPQFSAERCPKRSVYGFAEAVSPLLDKPLKGKVFLRSSNGTLPDLVAHLQGQLTIDLDGRIDNFRGGIRTTFASLPDVPLSRFRMTLPGGKRGLLSASTDLCRRPVRALVRLRAQNDKKLARKLALKVRCR